MSKIVLVLPGNSFHANQLSPAMEKMDRERAGLPVLRKYRIPVTTFVQGVDIRIKPWLNEERQKPGSVEWGCAPFSHSLLPLIDDAWRTELDPRYMVQGNVPVTFFSEFYVPQGNQIPTEYTLVLQGNSVLYSAFTDVGSSRYGDILEEDYPAEAHAVRFDGKVGILLREEWFAPFLKAFFLFQRFPVKGTEPSGRDCLAELMEVVAQIAQGPERRIVAIPLDMEAPWIGSHFGAEVWEIFCKELHRRGLAGVFAPLSKHLEQFDQEAVTTARPHRELTKWSIWEVQHQHFTRLNNLSPDSTEGLLLKAVASGSDIFAAWGIKLLQQRKGMTMLDAVDVDGRSVPIPITYNQSVVAVQLAAYRALVERKSFRSMLGTIKNRDHFVRLVIDTAERYGM